MNRLTAYIREIKYIENLHLVTLEIDAHRVTVITLELDKEFQISKKVLLSVKATNITIAKNFIGHVSDSNQISATVSDINVGHLLCNIKLKYYSTTFEAIITTDAYHSMNLRRENRVTLFIRAQDISIVGVVE